MPLERRKVATLLPGALQDAFCAGRLAKREERPAPKEAYWIAEPDRIPISWKLPGLGPATGTWGVGDDAPRVRRIVRALRVENCILIVV